MDSLDFNVRLQSNFVSYLNDAPFLTTPHNLIIRTILQSLDMQMQRQNDFSHILIELEVHHSDKKWQRLQRGMGSLLICHPEAIQILNNYFLRIIHKNKTLENQRQGND